MVFCLRFELTAQTLIKVVKGIQSCTFYHLIYRGRLGFCAVP